MSGRRILLYTHSLAGGGAERALALLASGLAGRGHDVIFATDYSATENAAFLDPAIRRLELGRRHAMSTWALRRALARERPDVSISALGANNVKHAAAALLAGRARRAVLAYHGFHESEPRPLARLAFWLAPALSRVVGRIVAVSDALRDNLVARWGCDPARTLRLYNPVAWRAAPTAHAVWLRAPLVLACGRLTADKNFAGLLRAFAALTRRDARLVILGEGEQRAALEGDIARLGLTGRVDLPGYVAEPWDFYARAACLAVSSRSESFGMAIVEALAHGVPVVSTDCGGPREILNSPTLGRLAPVGDDAALAEGIEAALASPGDPAPRVRRAADFSLARGVDTCEAMIETIVAELKSTVVGASPGGGALTRGGWRWRRTG